MQTSFTEPPNKSEPSLLLNFVWVLDTLPKDHAQNACVCVCGGGGGDNFGVERHLVCF